MLDKRIISVTIINGDDVDMKRVNEMLQNPSFTDEFHAVVSAKPMKFGSIEQMVQVLETILTNVKKSMPEQTAPGENPLFRSERAEE